MLDHVVLRRSLEAVLYLCSASDGVLEKKSRSVLGLHVSVVPFKTAHFFFVADIIRKARAHTEDV